MKKRLQDKWHLKQQYNLQHDVATKRNKAGSQTDLVQCQTVLSLWLYLNVFHKHTGMESNNLSQLQWKDTPAQFLTQHFR